MERPMSEDDQPKLEKNVPTSALTGHEEEKEEVVWEQIITPDGMFKRPSSDGIYGSLEVLKQPIIARLEELTSMDPTVEVGIEISDSVYLLNLINSANPEMQHAGLIARNAKHMQEVAPLVIRSQQIMRSALLLEDNIVNMPPKCFDGVEVGHEEKKKEVVWDQIITPDGMFKRPSSDGIYGSLEVLKQPIIARLLELPFMDPTVVVGIEISDLVYLLNLINAANPEMQDAGLQAREGAKQMQVGTRSVFHSQKFLRSALHLQDNSSDGVEVGEMGHEENEEEVVWDQIITPDGMFKRPSDGIHGSLEVLKQPIIARLEELTSMDPTVVVGIEISDSVYRLNLINAANPEMQDAGLQAREGAKQMQVGTRSVCHSQEILMFALLREDNIGNIPLQFCGIYESVKPRLASGSKGTKGESPSASGSKGTKGESSSASGSKGTKGESSSASGQVPLQTENNKR